MNNATHKNGIWFVYDGECPMCTQAAFAFKMKEQYGALHLINAREAQNDNLMAQINERGFDLDEGMVIYDGKSFFHGKDALRFMARAGKSKDIFNIANKMFYSDLVAKLLYPWMRGTRNLLLCKKNAPRIDNLNLKNEPIFKSVFGDDWSKLSPALQKHYANRPYTNDIVTVEGVMDVYCGGPIKLLAPIFWLLGGIPPHNEKNVPVTVHFESDQNTKSFHFNRIFHFKDKKPYNFRSRMLPIKDNELIEIMRFGIGWRMNYIWDNDRIKLLHKGYALHIFGHFIPLPAGLLLGEGYAEEIPVDDQSFDMLVTMKHPWWGKIYDYRGRFKVIENHD